MCPEPTQREIPNHWLLKVVTFTEGVHWVAHGNLAGYSFGPRLILEFRHNSETLSSEIDQSQGREDLAFDLIWHRAERGDIRFFGRKASLHQGDDDNGNPWAPSADMPEEIPAQILASASWTEDDDGGIEGERVSYWGITIAWDDLLACLPERNLSGMARAVESLRSRSSEAAGAAARSLASVETGCKQWIAEMVASGVIPRSRDDLFSRALQQFPQGLSRRAFDRCWDASAPESWKRAGRKPRKD